jgi:hypothetical protein
MKEAPWRGHGSIWYQLLIGRADGRRLTGICATPTNGPRLSVAIGEPSSKLTAAALDATRSNFVNYLQQRIEQYARDRVVADPTGPH